MLVLMLMLRSSFVMEVMVLDIAMSFVRPRRSTQIHALAPALSQQDALQAKPTSSPTADVVHCAAAIWPIPWPPFS